MPYAASKNLLALNFPLLHQSYNCAKQIECGIPEQAFPLSRVPGLPDCNPLWLALFKDSALRDIQSKFVSSREKFLDDILRG